MNETIMNKKNQLKAVLFMIGIMAVTLWIFFKDYSFKDLIYGMKVRYPVYLLLGFGMMLLFIYCEAINMRMIAKKLKIGATHLACIGYSFIGFYFSSITPSSSGGQPAQVYYMKRDGISITDSSLTIFFIVYVYQIAMVLLGIIMSVFRYRTAFLIASKLKYLLVFGIVMNTGAIVLFFLLMFSHKTIYILLNLCVKIGKKLRLIKNTEAWMDKMKIVIESYHNKVDVLKKHPMLFFHVFLVSMIQMIAMNSVSYFVYKSMGYSQCSFLDFMTGQALLTLSVSAVPLPGAVGASEGGFLYAFGSFFSADQIKAAMLISRGISFYLPLIISFIIYVLVHFRSTGNRPRGVKNGK